MSEQLDLLDFAARYPSVPSIGKTDTSKKASEKIDNKILRPLVFGAIKDAGDAGLTTSEAACILELPILNVSPRFSELRAHHQIKDPARRRENSGGNTEIVWVIA